MSDQLLGRIIQNPNFKISGILTEMVKAYLVNNIKEALSIPGMFKDVFLYLNENGTASYKLMYETIYALTSIDDAIFVCQNANIDSVEILDKFPELIHSVIKFDLIRHCKYMTKAERDAVLSRSYNHYEALYLLNKFDLRDSDTQYLINQLDFSKLHKEHTYGDMPILIRGGLYSVQNTFEKLINTASNRDEIQRVKDFIMRTDLFSKYSRKRRVIDRGPLFINDKVCRCGFAHVNLKAFKVHRYACDKKGLPLINTLLKNKLSELNSTPPLPSDANSPSGVVSVALESLSDANVAVTQSKVEQQTTQTTTL